MRSPASALLFLAAALSPLSALADTTYTYTGEPFTEVSGVYTTSDAITGQFTLATPLAASLSTDTVTTPLTFSFTDGVQTVTNASDLTEDFFTIQTDAAGNISLWDVYLAFNTPADQSHMETLNDFIAGYLSTNTEATLGHYSGGALVIDGATNDGLPGTWTETTTPAAATPEPGSLTLLATGVAATSALLRRRRTTSASR